MEIERYIEEASSMPVSARGENSECYLFSDVALLYGAYYEEHLKIMQRENEKLWSRGMMVPRVLEYRFTDENSNQKYREGWLLETRVKGKPLHQTCPFPLIFRPTTREEVVYNYEKEAHNAMIYERELEKLATAPQAHYDKFLSDMLVLGQHESLCYDATYASNFQYDSKEGFGFVDLTPRHVIDTPDVVCYSYLKVLLGKGNILKEDREFVETWIDQILMKCWIAMQKNPTLNNLYRNIDELKEDCYYRQFRKLGFLLTPLSSMEDYVNRGERVIETLKKMNLIKEEDKKVL